MLEAILGGIGGAVARMAPEVLKIIDRREERKHELALGKQAMEMAELHGKNAALAADVTLQQTQFTAAMEAMRTGITAQGQKSGLPFVDAINTLVRPAITFWIFFLYSMVKYAHVSMALEAERAITFQQAIASTWTDADTAMLAAVVTFFFVGRVWDKKGY